MDEIEKLLEQLAKVSGAGDLVKDLRAKFASASKEKDEALDTAKGEAAQAKKDAAAHKKTADAYKRDLDAGASSKDDAVKAAQKERDEWKGKAEAADRTNAALRRSNAIANALGILDPVRRADAAAAFERELPEDVTVNEQGVLVGAAKHLKAFKEGPRSYFWTPEDAAAAAKEKTDQGYGGPRGGDDKTLKNSGAGSKKDPTHRDKVKGWEDELFPGDKQQAAASK